MKSEVKWRYVGREMTRDAVDRIEQQLGVKLPEDYIEYALKNELPRQLVVPTMLQRETVDQSDDHSPSYRDHDGKRMGAAVAHTRLAKHLSNMSQPDS